MPGEVTLSLAALQSFLLVLTRVSFAFVFVPLPGARNAAEAPKVVFSLCVSLALLPFWHALPSRDPGFGRLAGWILSEAAFGLTVGLAVAFLLEAFTLAAQLLGLQAGYSYASTIDPTNQSDTGVLQVVAQLLAGMLFFTFGLDREVVRVFARSLDVYPPGTFQLSLAHLGAIQHAGALMFATALRLALPVIALLLLVDLALALVGRVNSQLQMLSLAFPAKMLGALAALGGLVAVFPPVFEKTARDSLGFLEGFLR
ncbi:MAG TPA: flagellar biosynthetic protein FliR [Bryobacteraceae bacterium]|nr:flagellar biosynthetic protein FliR [Bryobacteraceae bacterium]